MDARILDFSCASLPDIFANLAAGPEADVTVVTPNRRLAAALKRKFDVTQAALGRLTWTSADILPMAAFMERVYESAFYDVQSSLPALLTSSQEQVLWEDVIMRSESGAALLAVAGTARLAREAWEIIHAWELASRLRNFPLNEDAKAFRDWSRQYEQTCDRLDRIDHARLPTLVAELWERSSVRKPKRLFCYGFDMVTPQQTALLLKLHETGCAVVVAQPLPPISPADRCVKRAVFNDDAEEFLHAAAWARARLETNPGARIGIVVPRLAAYRSAIARTFDSVMEPGVQSGLAHASRTVPFNISLGITLDAYPLVNTALLVLEFLQGEMEFEQVSRLIRSPFLHGGETEMLARARLDARLRKRTEPSLALQQLLVLIERRDATGCAILLQALSAYAEFGRTRMPGSCAPSILARMISEALQLMGFPGERKLDSSEYQALKKWQEVLADFAALDAVTNRITYRKALSRLRQMTSEILFQPETADVPIQILGVLEAAGLTFDHLWVTGLSGESWPLQPRPNPLLPMELQRSTELPQGSAAASLKLARELTAAWFSAADEVILSHPRRTGSDDTGELAPSSLIGDIVQGELALPDYAMYRDVIHQSSRLESLQDDSTPAIRSGAGPIIVAGGLGVIKDQAACPFRASAAHRLGAEAIQAPSTGLDARERGILVHHLLAGVWSQLGSRQALDEVTDADLEAVLMQAAESAIAQIRKDRPATLSGRFAAIEQRRLMRLARDWLDEERKRRDFTVVAVEEKRSIEIGGLALTTRLDRVDELDDGRKIIIDYKIHAPSPGAMLGDRPDEPQLPLYLVTSEPDAAAVAFAQIRPGNMHFTALAREDDLFPCVKAFSESPQGRHHESWNALLADWRSILVRLAEDFTGGHAAIDPKNRSHTCRHCEIRLLCRIDERVAGKRNGDEEDMD